MQVILLKDIENLGKKYEIKDVKEGFAKNYLIPKGLVKVAREENLKWLKSQKENMIRKTEEELKKIQQLVSEIDGQEITIPVKAGEEGQVFGSVTVLKILRELKDLGFEIKKSQIELDKPIKELGEFPVKLNFPHGLEAEIKVIVEKKPEEPEEKKEE